MQSTRALLQHRQPMIRFLGKRSTAKSVDHTPHAHPAAPSSELPSSFAQYRQKAQQHGPLNGQASSSHSARSRPGASFGPVEPKQGQYFDRDQLPARFHRTPWTQAEIDAIDSGGASLYA